MTRCRLPDQLAIKFYHVRPQIPDTAQVCLASAKIIKHDQEAVQPQLADRIDE